ncbi:hypothetical protein [Clostridium butyricum]|uniref:hypothetical protein n=1 Tax=Clostridium butyricum TaxID=1492 RepID=UPI0005C23D76|nr:hypothetical protein [Clostridium butyricum]KIU07858.1 hypothetical protein SC08_Contig83orf01787 [Clostridium butyricum]MBA8967687.1 hypothetical protein [Clostridium butyricum]MBA8971245.1 hypothetical protein [Clostridium butyricum]MBC2427567.1 hypothetical protein [Clostridium butyricum]MDU5101430.1 hypothetical protein [Clostridium butyricum]
MTKDFDDFLSSIDQETFMTIVNKSTFKKCDLNSLDPEDLKSILANNAKITLDLLALYHDWLHS